MMPAAIAEHLAAAAAAAARAVAPLVGSGDAMRIDAVAVDALREHLRAAPCTLRVVSCEGLKDRAPMLAIGEVLGCGSGPVLELAADPIDGTRAAAAGRDGAIVALAAVPAGRLRVPEPGPYIERIAVGPAAAGVARLEVPLGDCLRAIAGALGKPVRDLVVAVLARTRNAPHRAAVEAIGAQVFELPDADLAATVAVALPGSGIDVAVGIAGVPETLLAACALRVLGGELVARHAPGASTSLAQDLAGGDALAFAAAGVTRSALLGPADAGRIEVLALSSGAAPRRWVAR